jgi:hypothetical protein
MTGSTKLVAKATPTSNPSTHSRAVVPQTFHTITSDTAAPLPFENPPHLKLTWRFSGSNLPDYELLFKHIFHGGDLTSRDCLLRLRTIASEQVRSKLGVALKHDDHGDPIAVVTRRTTPSSSMWATTGDVKIRFPSAEVAKAVYTQQRHPSRGNNSGLGHVKDVRGKRAAIMIPNGVIKSNADTVNLSKAYISCNGFRGVDNLQLLTLMLKTALDLYEASLADAVPFFLTPPPPI